MRVVGFILALLIALGAILILTGPAYAEAHCINQGGEWVKLSVGHGCMLDGRLLQ